MAAPFLPFSTLVERVKEREKNKKDLAVVYNEIFQKRLTTRVSMAVVDLTL